MPEFLCHSAPISPGRHRSEICSGDATGPLRGSSADFRLTIGDQRQLAKARTSGNDPPQRTPQSSRKAVGKTRRTRRRPSGSAAFSCPSTGLIHSYKEKKPCNTGGHHDDTEPRHRQVHHSEPRRRPQGRPRENGTCADVARVAEDYDGDVRSHNIANWILAGNADIRNGNNDTDYARFAKIYEDLLKEHGGAEANRTRELDRALEILARTCACGNEKRLLEDGTLAERCRACQELDATPRCGRRRTASTQDGTLDSNTNRQRCLTLLSAGCSSTWGSADVHGASILADLQTKPGAIRYGPHCRRRPCHPTTLPSTRLRTVGTLRPHRSAQAGNRQTWRRSDPVHNAQAWQHLGASQNP